MLKFALLAPALLLVPLSGATAQVGGSYRQSCTNINLDGTMLTAECRGAGGQRVTSTIDTARCGGGGVANANGRLTCGGVQGSAQSAGRPRNFGDQGQDDGGFRRPRPRYADQPDDGYGVPPRRPRFDQRRLPPPDYDDQGPPRGGYYDPDQ